MIRSGTRLRQVVVIKVERNRPGISVMFNSSNTIVLVIVDFSSENSALCFILDDSVL